jgi:phospholipase C
MTRLGYALLSILTVFCAAVLLLFNGCSGSQIQSHIIDPIPRGKIEHVLILFQENRTPDNLFQDPALIAAGADISGNGVNSSGQTVPLSPESLGVSYDLSHAHSAFVAQYDGGKMDGSDLVPVICYVAPCPANPWFFYVNPSEVQPYFQMAERYTFGDRMFQTNEGPSYPAHQFIISGTSAPTATSNLFVAENPNNTVRGEVSAGCAASPTAFVYLIDPSGNENTTAYPCTDHPTLTDQLDAKNISWKYYTPGPNSIWTGPNAIEHMCGPNATPPNATACVGSDWVNHVVLYTQANPAPILNDIANSQLPAVSWVIPAGKNSDHAGTATNTGGPSWVASIVNAIGNSTYWANTAIIVTWDDWGGWYDHVPPPKVIDDGSSWGSGYVYGFRVPLLVISPYAKAAYISHVNHDFGSILRFTEETFGLAPVGYADLYSDDLSDCFDMNQTPLVFQTINAPLSATHFLMDRTPPGDPDDD